jgi:MFS family permease
MRYGLVTPKSDVCDERFFTPQYALILATQFIFGLSFSAFFILPKFLATELHANAETIGRVTAIAGVAAVIAVPFIGASIDRFGRRRFILMGSLFQGIATFGFIYVDHEGPLLYGLRVFHGLAFAFAFNAAATLIADLAPPARLGRSLGIFGASNLVTNGIAPYILEPMSERYGWHWVFVVAGLASLLAVGMSFFIDEPESSVREEKTRQPENQHVVHELMPILFSSAMTGAAFGTLLTFYQPFALEIGITRVSGFFIGFTMTAIFSRVFLGGLADRFGRRTVACIALILYGCSVIAMAWLQSGTLVVLGACFGLAHGLFYPALNALAVEDMPKSIRGRVMSYFSGSFSFGFSVAILLLGMLAKRSGYPVIFIIAGSLTYLAAIVLWLTGPVFRSETRKVDF